MEDVRHKRTPLNANLSPELHHWWPKGLSAFWAGVDGKTARETPDGEVTRQRPENLGAIKNAHHVDLQGPWSHSFEPHFGSADSYFPHLITELLQLDSAIGAASEYEKRFTNATLTHESQAFLPECLASLAVRSPRFKKSVRQMLTQFGSYDENLSERDIIFSSNIGHCYPAMIESLRRCNLIIVLYSDNMEFIFGDGFFHNLPPSGDPIRNAKLLVPLTPCMAVAALVRKDCKSPVIRKIRLNNHELREINFVTQIYSIGCIFYREMRPEVDKTYFSGSFMSLKDQRWHLLEKMTESFSSKSGHW